MKIMVLFDSKSGKLLLSNYFFDRLINNITQDLAWDCKYLVTVTDSKGLPLTKDNLPYTPITYVTYYFDWLINNPGRDLGWLMDNLYWIIDWSLMFSSKFNKVNEADVVNIVILRRILSGRIRSSDMIKNWRGNSKFL